MKDKELATMLTSVAGEYARRGWPKAAARVLRRRDSLVPKAVERRVYRWAGSASSRDVPHWAWLANGAYWHRFDCEGIIRGDIFANHKPDASLTLEELGLERACELPADWSCE